MCDMACQTRESLFQPVFKNKVAQSPTQPPRFSTFGYDTGPTQPAVNISTQTPKQQQKSTGKSKKTVATTIEMEDVGVDPQTQIESATAKQQHQHHSHLHHQHNHPDIKKHKKLEESRIVLDIRNSAPDVIIMTSSH